MEWDTCMEDVFSVCLEPGDQCVEFFLGLAQALLEAAIQLVFFAFFEQEIVVGEDREFLFELTFKLVPVSFDCGGIHLVNFKCDVKS